MFVKLSIAIIPSQLEVPFTQSTSSPEVGTKKLLQPCFVCLHAPPAVDLLLSYFTVAEFP